jgi:hypothetical protein
MSAPNASPVKWDRCSRADEAPCAVRRNAVDPAIYVCPWYIASSQYDSVPLHAGSQNTV